MLKKLYLEIMFKDGECEENKEKIAVVSSYLRKYRISGMLFKYNMHVMRNNTQLVNIETFAYEEQQNQYIFDMLQFGDEERKNISKYEEKIAWVTLLNGENTPVRLNCFCNDAEGEQ